MVTMDEMLATARSVDDVSFFFVAVALLLGIVFLYMALFPLATAQHRPFDEHPLARGPAAPGRTSVRGIVEQLVERGATLYGADWCGFTHKQLAVLELTAGDLRGLQYVECGKGGQVEECTQNSIKGFPTWKIDGQLYPGFQDPNKLAELLR